MPKEAVTGGFAAPEGAPQEFSQPLSPELIAQQQAIARRNEKVLPPFNPPQRPRGLVAKATRVVEEFFGADAIQTPPEASIPVAVASPAVGHPDPEPSPLPPPEPWQPAASNTDSPSRGVPRPIPDQGKQITGGFGGLGPAQYFPLDGLELGKILCQKLDELKKRIQNDLRFSMAATYPRVQMFVEVEVRGFADMQNNFTVKTVPYDPKGADKGSTPVEVAREYGDEVCFVLLDAHIEMTPDGQSVTPPNKARIEAGLQVPLMQRVDSPSGGFIVDRT